MGKTGGEGKESQQESENSNLETAEGGVAINYGN